jgi:hypothetical protein
MTRQDFDRQQAEEQLQKVRELQADFFLELDDLRVMLGVDIDETTDLEDISLDDLLKGARNDDEM